MKLHNKLKQTCLAISLGALLPVSGQVAAISEIDINAPLLSNSLNTYMQESGDSISYQVLDGKAIIEGDIVAGEHIDVQLNGVPNLEVRHADEVSTESAWSGRTTWSSGIVPYVISATSASDTAVIQQGMSLISSISSITFVQRTSQTSYVNFIKGGGCYSSVGRTGGKQDISIGSGCGHAGIVAHELLHALGYWHEQSRFDRDSYVIIHTQNIQAGREHNFNKQNATSSSVGSYDRRSIMHYSHSAFSRNGQSTITPVDPNFSKFDLGQRNNLTATDASGVRAIYGGGGSSSGGSSSGGSSSGGSSSGGSSSGGGSCSSPQYSAGTSYSTGQLVRNIGNEYRCDVGGWCSSGASAYEPGVGLYWTSAWSFNKTCGGGSSSGGSSSGGSSSGGSSSGGSSSGGGSCSGLPVWNSSSVYTGGNQVQHNGVKYEAKWWTQGQDPAQNSSQWAVWKNLGSC